MFIYFDSLHVSSNTVLIIRRVNCINTTSGICHSVSVTVRYAGGEGTPSRPAHRTVTDTEWHIPDVVLIQLTLLMMSTGLLETCRESKSINTYKGIVRQVGYSLELYRDVWSTEYKTQEEVYLQKWATFFVLFTHNQFINGKACGDTYLALHRLIG
jgi:hypothetical protein